MSSKTMRQAAALMRERAKGVPPGRWIAPGLGRVTNREGLEVAYTALCDGARGDLSRYIASWHPDVALEVASWLDHQAKRAERAEEFGDYDDRHWQAPLVIANAYLGEEPTP